MIISSLYHTQGTRGTTTKRLNESLTLKSIFCIPVPICSPVRSVAHGILHWLKLAKRVISMG